MYAEVSGTLQAALDRLLVAPPSNAGPEAQQQHLKLLTEAYKRTLALSDSLQVATPPSLATQISMPAPQGLIPSMYAAQRTGM